MSIHCISYICDKTPRLLTSIWMLLGLLHSAEASRPIGTHGSSYALLGDSMTWIGGSDCENPTGWTHILKKSGMADTIEVYARSGATWTNSSSTQRNTSHYSEVLDDDNVVYNQAIRLIERADTTGINPSVIILFAGANDAWFASRRPGIYSPTDGEAEYSASTEPSAVTSLFGSVTLTCGLLKDRFPESDITLVTPLQMSKTDAETISKVSDIIEEAGKKKSCFVIRADRESGITHNVESQKPKYTYDGVHTNPDGARLVGELIVSKLQNHIGEKTHQ